LCVCHGCFVLLTRGRLETRPEVALGSSPELYVLLSCRSESLPFGLFQSPKIKCWADLSRRECDELTHYCIFGENSVSLQMPCGTCVSGHPKQNFIDLASTWAPCQDLANHNLWTASLLLALKQAHQVFLTDLDEWSVNGPAP